MTSDYCSGHERCYCCYNWESRYCRVILFKHFIRNSRYWSPRLATSRWLCLSVRMSVTNIAPSFLFLGGIEPFLGRQFIMTLSTKRCSFIFDLGPLTPNIYSPQICTKSSIIRLVRQIDRTCLGLPGGFRGWPIQWNHTKCCGVDPCCHGNEIWARRGDPVAYRLIILHSCFCLFLQLLQLLSLLQQSHHRITQALSLLRLQLPLRLKVVHCGCYNLQYCSIELYTGPFLPCDGLSYRNSVCLSVCPSVCHTRALCPHGSTYDHDFFTIW